MDDSNAAPTALAADVLDALTQPSAAVQAAVAELQLRIGALHAELDRTSQPVAARLTALTGALATNAANVGRTLEGLAWT